MIRKFLMIIGLCAASVQASEQSEPVSDIYAVRFKEDGSWKSTKIYDYVTYKSLYNFAYFGAIEDQIELSRVLDENRRLPNHGDYMYLATKHPDGIRYIKASVVREYGYYVTYVFL